MSTNNQKQRAELSAQSNNDAFKFPAPDAGTIPIPKIEPFRARDGETTSQHPPIHELMKMTTVFTSLPQPVDDSQPFYNATVECIIHSATKAAILALPNFPQPVKVNNTPAYAIRVDKFAGLGMFAARDLDIGDLILAERPLMLTAQGALTNQAMLLQAIDGMDDKRRDAFLALKNVKGWTRSFALGLCDTNAVCVSGLPGYPYQCTAVCDEISRINHSCSPNCVWAWHLESFAMEVRAISPIKKGEQIFGNYGVELEPRVERREFLSRRYKFHCICSCCSLSDAESKASDARRSKLNNLTATERPGNPVPVTQWLSQREAKFDNKLIDECMYVIDMMNKEGFWPTHVWPAVLERLVQAYCCLEDATNASRWASEASVRFKAENLGDDAGWSLVAENPQATKWWGMRKDPSRILQKFGGERMGWDNDSPFVIPFPDGVGTEHIERMLRNLQTKMAAMKRR